MFNLKFGFLFLAYQFCTQLCSLDNVSSSMFLFFLCFIKCFLLLPFQWITICTLCVLCHHTHAHVITFLPVFPWRVTNIYCTEQIFPWKFEVHFLFCANYRLEIHVVGNNRHHELSWVFVENSLPSKIGYFLPQILAKDVCITFAQYCRRQWKLRTKEPHLPVHYAHFFENL